MGSKCNAKTHVLKNGREWITSPFGTRTDPVTGKPLSKHNGIDLIDEVSGTDYIIAFADGIVEAVQTNVKGLDTQVYTAGNYVKIKHDNEFSTRYLHMKYGSISLKVGDKVKKGQIIGYMGSTGYSTGNHLHFEVWKNGVRVDPLPYLRNEKSFDKKTDNLKAGDKVNLKNAPLYGSSTAKKKSNTVSGVYYIHSDGIINKRIRITTPKGCEDVTGWVNVADCGVKAINEGDVVKVSKSAETWDNGVGIPDWVYGQEYVVDEISGNRAVIGQYQNGKFIVTGAINVKYLVRA